MLPASAGSGSLQIYFSRGGLALALYADISPNPRDDEIALA